MVEINGLHMWFRFQKITRYITPIDGLRRSL
jgi:hypothetical protein